MHASLNGRFRKKLVWVSSTYMDPLTASNSFLSNEKTFISILYQSYMDVRVSY